MLKLHSLNRLLILPLGALILVQSCKTPAGQNNILLSADSSFGNILADTIIYDVVIQNPNPDDTWTSHCLSGLKRKQMVDHIFDMIYSEKLVAFDHLTHEKLTPKQVRKIESTEGFSRDQISMIQFTEAWYMREDTPEITKRVLSMVLGYNFDTPEGERFYKALFKVELNP
jgi:hypothetical protein